VHFLQCVLKAQAEFVSKNLKKLQKEPDHHAPEWLLERKAPEEWGRKDRKSEEVTKPREGVTVDAVAVDAVAVDAVAVDPIAVILDEAKK
jgi:hypothetical protein